MKYIKQAFEATLPRLDKKRSAGLGDRGTYVGASDVGKCFRSAVLGKIRKGVPAPPGLIFKSMVRFFRGHWAETILDQVLKEAGYTYTSQADLTHPDIPFAKAHPDFLIHNGGVGGLAGATKIRVVEQKCPDLLPEDPRDSWVLQLYFQMGIVKTLFPQAEIVGSIFVFDLFGDYEEYDGFVPNQAVFAGLEQRAQLIHQGVKGEVTPKAEPSLLCGHCAHRADCPAWNYDSGMPIPEDVAAIIKEIAELSRASALQDKQIKFLKKELASFLGESRYTGIVDEISVKYSYTEPQKAASEEKLALEFPEVFQDPSVKKEVIDQGRLKELYPEIYDAVQVETRKGFWTIRTDPLSKEKPAKEKKSTKKAKESAEPAQEKEAANG